jgi:hypothetical protein
LLKQAQTSIEKRTWRALLEDSFIHAPFFALSSLPQAQTNKLDAICEKLHLKKGGTMLDIGCGWGTLVRHAASKFGVKVRFQRAEYDLKTENHLRPPSPPPRASPPPPAFPHRPVTIPPPTYCPHHHPPPGIMFF